MPLTFEVDPTATPKSDYAHPPSSLEDHLQPLLENNGGRIITASNSSKNYVRTRFASGFVGACIYAYNNHHELVLGPDETWVAITTSLSRYINANAKKLRDKFVSHQGKIELEARGWGTLSTANYDDLISQISDGINKKTKGDVREWIESDFSTTTPLKRVVSKVVLMTALQQYFSYKMYLECGLPKVTLDGTVEDWKKIRQKVKKLKEFSPTLAEWSEVLGDIIDRFVDAFTKPVDKDFWNRIAHITGGGSGPRYLEGWVVAFVAFDEKGKYLLPSLASIKKNNSYGRMDTNDVPSATVQVPVTIDDNGVEHQAVFYAGPMLATLEKNSMSPALDWVLVVPQDITKENL